LLGFLAFFVVSLAVGIRLIRLWWRTRQLPELLIGIGVLGIGPVGFGSMMVGVALLERAAASAELAFAIGSVSAYFGVLAQCVFTWRVYHPDAAWVKGVVVLFGLGLAAVFVARLAATGFVPTPTPDATALAQSTLQVCCLLWASVEALRYWGLMRRRARLGLSDPVVCNRFLLWGIGAGAAGVGSAVGSVASFVIGIPSLQIPWVVASSSAHGFVAAVVMSLAFLPPPAYLRWLRAGAGSGAPASVA
jgi:hypothetical protein